MCRGGGGGGSPVSAKMSTSYAVVTNDIYALTSEYWGLGCVFYLVLVF